MSLKLGDLAPNFAAETTHGVIDFHQWLGDRWGVLFSHPRDFTPVCTTELGLLAKLAPEFERRGVRVMGLSVDSLDAHREWSKDILAVTGAAPNFPMIADPDLDRLLAEDRGTPGGDAGQLAAGRRRHHRPWGFRQRRPASATLKAGARPRPISAMYPRRRRGP